jgi:hypothetical protein
MLRGDPRIGIERLVDGDAREALNDAARLHAVISENASRVTEIAPSVIPALTAIERGHAGLR